MKPPGHPALPKSPLNLLVAYPYWANSIGTALGTLPRECYRLMIDSGAYTAMTQGKDITLDEYCRFLDSIEHLRPFQAIQLDVIGDPDATFKNYLKMRERGYDVMPVFTRGHTVADLEALYELTDYILFGGTVSGAGNLNYIKWLMEHVGDRKVHWLGFVNIGFLQRYRPFSVDSSTWAGWRFGRLETYAGFGRIASFRKAQFAQGIPDEVRRNLLRTGAPSWMVRGLLKNDAWIGSQRYPTPGDLRGANPVLSMLSHLHRADDTEKNIGTRVYLASPAAWALQLIEAYRHWAGLLERRVA